MSEDWTVYATGQIRNEWECSPIYDEEARGRMPAWDVAKQAVKDLFTVWEKHGKRIQKLERRMLELEQRRLLDKRDQQEARIHPNLNKWELPHSEYMRLKAIEEAAIRLAQALERK